MWATQRNISTRSHPTRPASDLPAYDFEILDIERPLDLQASGTDGKPAWTTVEIEGLEPGMGYTWRVVIETAGGKEVTEAVTCETSLMASASGSEDLL